MNKFLTVLMLLPILEIIGFIVIGSWLGFKGTLLWLFCSTFFGVKLLRGDATAWTRVKATGDDVFEFEEAFDSLCVLLAGILLVIPGFISDIIALLLLVPDIRRLVLRRLKGHPDSIIRKNYHTWMYARQSGAPRTTPGTIDGQFTRIDDTPKLPEQ